jgi:hypothetical protein
VGVCAYERHCYVKNYFILRDSCTGYRSELHDSVHRDSMIVVYVSYYVGYVQI